MPSPASANIDLTDDITKPRSWLWTKQHPSGQPHERTTGAILESGYGKAARARWGDGFVERYEVNRKLNSPEIEELSIREQALVSEYPEAVRHRI